jgi:aryl-alcohol dehydrogenase-like predicted oxidoreductase
MQSMAQLVKEGKVSAVGLSNYSANGMKTASQELEKHNINLASNQVKFNLLNRRIETNGVLKVAKELGITIIAYSPLAQGLLTGKYHSEPRRARQLPSFRKIYNPVTSRRLKESQPVIDVIRELAHKYHVSPPQIALNWVIHVHGERIVTIAGASKASQAKDNASSLTFKLSEEDMARLDSVSLAYASS